MTREQKQSLRRHIEATCVRLIEEDGWPYGDACGTAGAWIRDWTRKYPDTLTTMGDLTLQGRLPSERALRADIIEYRGLTGPEARDRLDRSRYALAVRPYIVEWRKNEPPAAVLGEHWVGVVVITCVTLPWVAKWLGEVL